MKLIKKILITAGIILLLAGVPYIIMRAPSIYNAALWRSAKPNMAPIQAAINLFVSHTGKYPNTLDDLMTPPSLPAASWKGPYIKVQFLYDPWNRPYIYVPNLSNPKNYDLISYGADGKPGGKGYNEDVSNK
jgi:general secretion pathway protein G